MDSSKGMIALLFTEALAKMERDHPGEGLSIWSLRVDPDMMAHN